jgi:hypothetical protein
MLSQSAIDKIKNFSRRYSIPDTKDIRTYSNQELLVLIEILRKELEFLEHEDKTANTDTYFTIRSWLIKLNKELDIEDRETNMERKKRNKINPVYNDSLDEMFSIIDEHAKSVQVSKDRQIY